MKTLATLIFISLYSLSLYSQSNTSREELIKTHQKKVNNAKGTYQVQIINSREKAAVPYNIYEIVEEKRHETDTIYHFIYPKVRLMILPNSVIKKEDFVPVEEFKNVPD